MRNNRPLKLFLVLCALAFLDAAYLTFIHYSKSSVLCLIGNGCDIVNQSIYAVVGPVPVALIGVLYFGSLFGAVFYSAKKRAPEIMRSAVYFSFFGAVAAIRFIYLQIFVLHAVCFYCAVTDTIALILPFLAWQLMKGVGVDDDPVKI